MLSFMTFFIALQLIAANSDTAIYNFLTIPDIFRLTSNAAVNDRSVSPF